MATACARLSEANAGLTGRVTMRSASATSSFSRPAALATEQHGDVLAGRHLRRQAKAACSGAITGLAWSWARAVVASTSVQSAIAASTVS